MFKIILTSAWRQIWKNRGYSSLNILGLAVGLSVAMLSALWVQHQVQYDQFHTNGDAIYRAMQDYSPSNGEMVTVSAVPLPLAAVLRDETPGIKRVATTDWGFTNSLLVGDKRLLKEGLHVEPDFLKMFSFPLVQGDLNTALSQPNQIVISERTATALFGEADPMGQTINIDNAVDVMVTGVMKDTPLQSTLRYDFYLPFSLKMQRQEWVRNATEHWGNFSFQVYYELEANASPEQVKSLHKGIFIEHDSLAQSTFNYHPLADWHLRGTFTAGVADDGRIRYVQLFGIIGVLVLLIACINFINLNTARAEKRSKEVGVRKAIGAQRGNLIVQFLGETGLIIGISFLLAIIIVNLALPAFNTLVDEEMSFPWLEPQFYAVSLGVLSFVTLLAGSYPAFFLTRFQAREVLQKTFQTGRGSNLWSRRALVCIQFMVSIALIAGSIIVHKQVQYAQSIDKGYNQERLVSIPNTPGLNEKADTYVTELNASGMVKSVTSASSPITSVWSNMSNIGWPGKPEGEQFGFAFIATGPEYFQTLEIDMVEGRMFRSAPDQDTSAMIINEAAVKVMGLEDPLSTVLTWGDSPYRVIGVVEDVVMETPYEPVRATVFTKNSDWRSYFLMRLADNRPTEAALATIGEITEAQDPATPFNYDFVEDVYNRKFRTAQFIGQVALIFAGLAVFLSALGLLGLAVYLAERRSKEISIRKILGANVAQLWLLLSSEFMVLILVGGLLAVPLGAYFLQDWLDNYTNRIELPWMVFGLAAGIALSIALLTISFQSIKAALVNPADRLRSE